MERDESNPDRRILKLAKSNYSKIGTEIAITWENGVFVHDPQSSGLDAQAANSKAKRVFLSLLENHNENRMSVNANGGSTYAPKVFAGHPECEGVTKKAFVNAMKSLFAEKVIRTEKPSVALICWCRSDDKPLTNPISNPLQTGVHTVRKPPTSPLHTHPPYPLWVCTRLRGRDATSVQHFCRRPPYTNPASRKAKCLPRTCVGVRLGEPSYLRR